MIDILTLRSVISDLSQLLISQNFDIQPFDIIANPFRIRAYRYDSKDKADILEDTKYSIYELFLAKGWAVSQQTTDLCELQNSNVLIRVLTNPSMEVDFIVAVLDTRRPLTGVTSISSLSNTMVSFSRVTPMNIDLSKQFDALAKLEPSLEVTNTEPVNQQTKLRLSYRLPPNTRGTLGTGYYSVHYGDDEVGKLVCDSDDHDPDKPNWRCVLYKGFDPLAYPDKDKHDFENGSHVVINAQTNAQELYSGAYGTLHQGRSWIRSSFDRAMWESALVPY